MQCFVYRSSIKAGLYVYLLHEDGLDALPDPIRRQMGAAELALSFDFSQDRTLSSENPADVRKNLENLGYHVQMPKDIEPLLKKISGD